MFFDIHQILLNIISNIYTLYLLFMNLRVKRKKLNILLLDYNYL